MHTPSLPPPTKIVLWPEKGGGGEGWYVKRLPGLQMLLPEPCLGIIYKGNLSWCGRANATRQFEQGLTICSRGTSQLRSQNMNSLPTAITITSKILGVNVCTCPTASPLLIHSCSSCLLVSELFPHNRHLTNRSLRVRQSHDGCGAFLIRFCKDKMADHQFDMR